MSSKSLSGPRAKGELARCDAKKTPQSALARKHSPLRQAIKQVLAGSEVGESPGASSRQLAQAFLQSRPEDRALADDIAHLIRIRQLPDMRESLGPRIYLPSEALPILP